MAECELCIPKSSIKCIIKDGLESTQAEAHPVKVSNDFKDMLAAAGALFVRNLADTAETLRVSNGGGRKNIETEDILLALKQLGYSEVASECGSTEEETREKRLAKRRRAAANKLKQSQCSSEEFLRQQQMLFEEARQAHLTDEEEEGEGVEEFGEEGQGGTHGIVDPVPVPHLPESTSDPTRCHVAVPDEDDFDI